MTTGTRNALRLSLRELDVSLGKSPNDTSWRKAAVCSTSLFRLSIMEELASLRPRRLHSRRRSSGEAKAIGARVLPQAGTRTVQARPENSPAAVEIF
jgi:hypothetical protein